MSHPILTHPPSFSWRQIRLIILFLYISLYIKFIFSSSPINQFRIFSRYPSHTKYLRNSSNIFFYEKGGESISSKLYLIVILDIEYRIFDNNQSYCRTSSLLFPNLWYILFSLNNWDIRFSNLIYIFWIDSELIDFL